jgi:hypothetical protein
MLFTTLRYQPSLMKRTRTKKTKKTTRKMRMTAIVRLIWKRKRSVLPRNSASNLSWAAYRQNLF